MLESDAKQKRCHMTMRAGHKGEFCQGSECMGWQEFWHRIPIGDTTQTEWAAKDPPEGDCNVKTPEFNCNYG